jgi:tRNA(adenine34) deaminase
MNHEHFMREALKEARKSFEEGDVPVGAIIVYDNKIIARAHNQVELLKDPTAHAEILAITQAAAALNAERLYNASLYVTLEPCSMCAGAMVLGRIENVYYAARDQKAGACGSLYTIVDDDRLNHQVKVIHGLLQKEGEELLKEFFRTLRRDKR